MIWPNVFLFCFATGSIWAIAALLLGGLRFGHVGHVHHGSVKIHAHAHHGVLGHLVNPSCLAVFLAWFGAAGYVLWRHSNLPVSLQLLIAASLGLIGAAILARFLAFLQTRERILNPVDYEMVGTLGQVASAIRPAGVGEILYVRDGARRAVPARSEDGVAIERGCEVIVLRFEKGIAYVRNWDAMAR